jgi:succinyl-CoA synthetase alpha subunit
MSILIDRSTRVLVQGITGREGMRRTELMMQYGTRVVAGCTPGKGGRDVLGVPVYDTVEEAVECCGAIDVSVIFVPAPLVKNAALEALDAGIPRLVLIPDRVPVYDVMEIAEKAKGCDATFIGPNTLGLLSPGKAVLGMIGGRAETANQWFHEGPVGVTSRSGGMTASLGYYLCREGIGVSTMVHVGGDAVVGLPHPDVVMQFQDDPDTHLIVMFGEIGTSQEDTVAELLMQGKVTKPVVAYIGGKEAKQGTRFSHAGAIIEGSAGTWEAKVGRLREAGAHVVEHIDKIPHVAAELLKLEDYHG